MKDLMVRLLSNPHTSGAAIVYGICALGEIWFPNYADQFTKTRQAAVTWGLLFAGDAGKKAKEEPLAPPPKTP